MTITIFVVLVCGHEMELNAHNTYYNVECSKYIFFLFKGTLHSQKAKKVVGNLTFLLCSR